MVNVAVFGLCGFRDNRLIAFRTAANAAANDDRIESKLCQVSLRNDNPIFNVVLNRATEFAIQQKHFGGYGPFATQILLYFVLKNCTDRNTLP